MFYAKIKRADGTIKEGLYHGWARFYADTFAPGTREKLVIDFKTPGKTYKEKQHNLRETAINWIFAQPDSTLSCGEYAAISRFFKRAGKRYGLLKEFRENCIC